MSKLGKVERNTAMALSGVVGLRMFGLFLIMPVFTIYALRLPGANAFLVGLAIGVYGFSQALLQVPVGLASDRVGRHLTITVGLAVFLVGSIVAAMAGSITGVIIGRVLQGMGAVSGASQALAADHSNNENRNKVMGIIGVSIGFAFIFAIILSAPLASIAGLEGLFLLTALLALAAIVFLWWLVPRPKIKKAPEAAHWSAVFKMIVKPELGVMNLSIFMMHCMLTATFVALPLTLNDRIGLSSTHQWELYLPVMIVAVLVMGTVLRKVTSRSGSMYLVIICAIALALSLLGFDAKSGGAVGLWLAAIVFFSAFNLLEATLPALVSRLASEHLRGAAMGAYATCQFLGAGVGGMVGGYVLGHYGQGDVYMAAACLLVVWLPLLFWGKQRVLSAVPA